MQGNDFRELNIRFDCVHVEVTFISNTATFQANSSIKTNILHAFVKVTLQIPSISV